MKTRTIIFLLISTLLCGPVFAKSSLSSIMGDVRVNAAVNADSDPAVVEYQGDCGMKRPLNAVHLWKDRVMDVTLWLTLADPSKNIKLIEPTTIETVGDKCEFWPKFVVLSPNSIIRVKNTDLKTQWLVVEDGKNKKQYMQDPGGTPIDITVKEGKDLRIFSAFYPWMEAFIKPVSGLVMTTTTEWDGRFFFKDIPEGDYILHAWNRALGQTFQEVSTRKGHKTKVEVRFNAPSANVPIIEATKLEELKEKEGEKHENPFK